MKSLGRVLFVSLSLVAGCYSYDAQTIDSLNNRLSRIESGSPGNGDPDRKTVQGQGWLGSGNYVVVYVRMQNGGMMPVKIVQKNTTVFEGPRGELYNGVPTPEQLRGEYAPQR